MEVIHASARPGEAQETLDSRVVAAIADSRCDHILALSMKSRVSDMEGVRKAIAGRPVLYWEGDPWGQGKPIPDEMRAWLSLAETVFSVGGRPQTQLLRNAGAARVVGTIHTYDHILFSDAEEGRTTRPITHDVVVLGSNLMRFPLISGLPGSWQRYRLVARLRTDFGRRFLLGGPGWPRDWSVGAVPFNGQASFLQRGHVVANWDHYPGIHSYTSDRMAIAMIAGRVQVSTRHPRMDWLPGPKAGLFLAESPSQVRHIVHDVLRQASADDLGRAAHAWAHDRISHRQAVRHMLSTVWDHVEPPPSDPWANIPREHDA